MWQWQPLGEDGFHGLWTILYQQWSDKVAAEEQEFT
jgi:hypothetical protein